MEMKMNEPFVVKEETRGDGGGEEGGRGIKKFGAHDGDALKSSSPNHRDSSFNKQEDQLESTKAEMGEVREENERLKLDLARIVKDYRFLQMKFFDVFQQEQDTKLVETLPICPDVKTLSIPDNVEEAELISLRLGTSVRSCQKKEVKRSTSRSREDDMMEKDLALGLDCKFNGSSSIQNASPSNPSVENNSLEEIKEEEAGKAWPPSSKVLRSLKNEDDEVSQQAHVKKARVSVRARCDAPTMNDGCQWRKYGQKIAKGNPCPRAYYRCTVAPACPVRKQVQRCAEDMSILITTYEGNHNHPLPISATSMASTTSAAACMLMSGSTTSQPGLASQTIASTISSSNPKLQGLNFGLFDNSRSTQVYLPNSTISSTPSHPTITLDLTTPQSSAAQASKFNMFTSSLAPNSRYASSASFSLSSSVSNTLPTSWSNGQLSYGAQSYNRSHLGSMSFGRPTQESIYNSYLHNSYNPSLVTSTQHLLTDTIAKAITSDPSFQSALATAITSYVGTNGSQGGGEGGSIKWEEHSNSTAAASRNGCASSYLTRTTSNPNPQQGNLLLQAPLALLSSKSASASPVNNRENTN